MPARTSRERKKMVIVTFERKETQIILNILVQGNGFDFQKFLDISPERSTHIHGRGTALAKMLSFDTLEYIGNGNQVQVSVTL